MKVVIFNSNRQLCTVSVLITCYHKLEHMLTACSWSVCVLLSSQRVFLVMQSHASEQFNTEDAMIFHFLCSLHHEMPPLSLKHRMPQNEVCCVFRGPTMLLLIFCFHCYLGGLSRVTICTIKPCEPKPQAYI